MRVVGSMCFDVCVMPFKCPKHVASLQTKAIPPHFLLPRHVVHVSFMHVGHQEARPHSHAMLMGGSMVVSQNINQAYTWWPPHFWGTPKMLHRQQTSQIDCHFLEKQLPWPKSNMLTSPFGPNTNIYQPLTQPPPHTQEAPHGQLVVETKKKTKH